MFSALYTAALNKMPTDRGIARMAGQAQALPLANQNVISAKAGGFDPIPSESGSRHIPLARQHQPGTNDDTLHERALALRAYRQQILASNIANADTPGYKAVDFDIHEALRNGHSTASSIPLQYHVPSQDSVDGNTVEMDVERAKFAENALMYEYALARVSGHYKDMAELLKNMPY